MHIPISVKKARQAVDAAIDACLELAVTPTTKLLRLKSFQRALKAATTNANVMLSPQDIQEIGEYIPYERKTNRTNK